MSTDKTVDPELNLRRVAEVPAVQPADHRLTPHGPELRRLNGPPIRRILFQPEVGPRPVVVLQVPLNTPTSSRGPTATGSPRAHPGLPPPPPRGHDFLIAFSCKGLDICPSCAGRRMAEMAAFVHRFGDALNSHVHSRPQLCKNRLADVI